MCLPKSKLPRRVGKADRERYSYISTLHAYRVESTPCEESVWCVVTPNEPFTFPDCANIAEWNAPHSLHTVA